jgi:MFS family permease
MEEAATTGPVPGAVAPAPDRLTRAGALRFVVLLGLVSLLADLTYEGARSSTGPYLALLGASATAVGIVAGLGELFGYGLRLASGYLADRTGRYWATTIAGYALNLLAVPALALVGRWELAALLMLLERTGKALRTPARDAMLSRATTLTGHGWGFGLHEAMDQAGALLGPLVVAGVVAWQGGYRAGFAALLVPALLALVVLLLARARYPHPQALEPLTPDLHPEGLPRVFWVYLAGAALVAAGFADFPLVAFHFERAAVLQPALIPLVYALAMGVDAVAALILGRAFDRVGLPVLAAVTIVTAAFAPLAFLGGAGLAVLGVVLWGVGLGAHESIMRAAVATMVGATRRGTAYGLFNTGYGLAWFAGSALMGVLYDVSLSWLVAFCLAAQLAAVPLLLTAGRMHRPRPA